MHVSANSTTESCKIIPACLKIPALVLPGKLASPCTANQPISESNINSHNLAGIFLHHYVKPSFDRSFFVRHLTCAQIWREFPMNYRFFCRLFTCAGTSKMLNMCELFVGHHSRCAKQQRCDKVMYHISKLLRVRRASKTRSLAACRMLLHAAVLRTGWFIWSRTWVGLTLIQVFHHLPHLASLFCQIPISHAELGKRWNTQNPRADESPCTLISTSGHKQNFKIEKKSLFFALSPLCIKCRLGYQM